MNVMISLNDECYLYKPFKHNQHITLACNIENLQQHCEPAKITYSDYKL